MKPDLVKRDRHNFFYYVFLHSSGGTTQEKFRRKVSRLIQKQTSLCQYLGFGRNVKCALDLCHSVAVSHCYMCQQIQKSLNSNNILRNSDKIQTLSQNKKKGFKKSCLNFDRSCYNFDRSCHNLNINCYNFLVCCHIMSQCVTM